MNISRRQAKNELLRARTAQAHDSSDATEFLTLRGRRIALRRSGFDGSLVILAHASASHSGQWRPLIDEMCRSFRMVAPDLHGYGRSDPSTAVTTPSYANDAAILAEIVAADSRPAHLVGHGFGAVVAARVARDNPAQVASLTMIEPTAFQLLEESRDPRREEHLELSNTLTALVAFEETEKAARLFVDYWSGEGAFDAMDPEPKAYVVSTMGRVADDLHATIAAAPAQMMFADFQELRPRVHLICGAKTRSSARAVVARLRRAIPDSQYTEITTGDHMTVATHPRNVNPAITAFIEQADNEYG